MSKQLLVKGKVWVDVDQDNYEQGIVSEGINSWEIELETKLFYSLENLMEAINDSDYLFFKNLEHVDYEEGVLYSEVMVNEYNQEPSEYEMEQFKAGKIDLYSARASVHLQVIDNARDLEEADEKFFGLIK